jgi:chemotaxis family two-component system sensor histidine kinase/response regulator PixL
MANRGRRELILIVEDDAELRDAMRMLLELGGYNVETACDGTQALDTLRRGLQPRLILLDLMMPGMDGFQFVNEKRQDPRLYRIPVIIYSGHYDARANAARLGATAYLQKPFDVDSFLKLVRSHC